jgi:hypothetical protein
MQNEKHLLEMYCSTTNGAAVHVFTSIYTEVHASLACFVTTLKQTSFHSIHRVWWLLNGKHKYLNSHNGGRRQG